MRKFACMSTQHAKSPCCGASVSRFGERRRQCVQCKKTWRIRPKKRGRKAKRSSLQFITAYLEHRNGTLRQQAELRGTGKSSAGRFMDRSLVAYVKQREGAWQGLIAEEESLLLIADAIWYRISGVKHAIYCMLLRARHDERAVILPPVVLVGHEDTAGWLFALETMPESLRARIGALVCDGGSGVVALAHRHNWLLQRCQFHLLSAVQNYLTTGPRSKHPEFARQVMRDVQAILSTSSLDLVRDQLVRLSTLRRATRSRGLRRVLTGLELHIDEYRTCFLRPEWRLPATNNTAESFIQCIRDLMYRCRGFRTQEKLALWLKALAAHKKTICCRPKNQPN